MTDRSIPGESDLLAAEFALGLLAESEMRPLRIRLATDPAFADAVARWEERLAPLADESGSVTPDASLWLRIEGAIAASDEGNDNVVALRKTPGRMQAYATAMTAIAASLAIVIGYQQLREPPVASQQTADRQVPAAAPPAAPQPTLVASLASTRETTALTVTFDPRDRGLTVIASRLASQSSGARELWIIPAGGSPVSLGVVRPGDPVRRQLPETIAHHFNAAASIAISIEPTGGSPTGQPTGPVIASGALITA